MIYRNKKTIRITWTIITLFIIAGIIHYLYGFNNIYLDSISTISMNLIYTGLALFWGITLHQRVLQKNILHYLQVMDAGIVFLMISRYVKYDFFKGVAERYIWYLYYIPQIIVPLVLLFCALSIGRREDEGINRKWNLLFIPAIFLCIGIMTNDFHNLAFKFQPGMSDWSSKYSHEILYYATLFWMIGLMIISVAIIIENVKCVVVEKRHGFL